MEWQPDNETRAWAKEHFAQIPEGGIWAPEGTGVQYRRMGEKTYALMLMYNHPEAEDFHQKFKMLFEACGYTIEEGDNYQIVEAPLDPREQAQQEHERKRALAEAWKCPNCDRLLMDNNYFNVKHEYIDTVDAPLSDGSTQTIEVWASNLPCGGCDETIVMEPDDFLLLAGDDAFMQWEAPNGKTYHALPRHVLKQMAEADETGGLHIMGGTVDGHRAPPWLWGLVCTVAERSEEE